MRTTLDLEDDVLAAARQLAAQRRSTMGKVISELARKGLRPTEAPKVRNGVLVFPVKPGAEPVTMELVNRLRDEE